MRFADVVGHERVKKVLCRALEKGKVPHAYLFSGPEGVGKRTMALAFLSYLNCKNRQEGDSCGGCSTCRAIDAGRFVDLHQTTVERGQIRIDEVRSILSRLYMEPAIGPWKCVLIDDAHLLNLPAANAALKTLEEPPPRTLFILISPSPDLLPPTVLSRCFHIAFGPLSAQEVIAVLRRLLPERAEEEVTTAAVLAQGSPGKAKLFVEHPVLRERRSFLEAFMALASQSLDHRLNFSEGVSAAKDDSPLYLTLIASLLGDILLLAAGLGEENLSNPDLACQMRAFLERTGVDRVLSLVDTFKEWDEVRFFQPSVRAFLDRMVLSLGPRI